MATDNSAMFKMKIVRGDPLLTLKHDNVSGDVVGSDESDKSDQLWAFELIADEYFHITGKIPSVEHEEHEEKRPANQSVYLKLHFKQPNECDRSVKVETLIDEKNKERYQWQLIPIERGKSFLIMNIARKAYLRLNQKDRIAEASQGIKNHNDDFAWQLILPTRKNESKDEEGSRLSLLNLFLDSSISDENLLKELMKWFPELDTTPDLVAQREHPNKTLVLAVFGEEWVERSTSEVIAATNRLLLRLVYLRSLMRNDQTYFPLITPERFNYLCKNLVLPCCQDEERVIFLVLSTILDALGRTTKIQDKINKEHIPAEPGHDYKYGHEEYLRTYLKKFHFVDFNQGFRHFKDQTEKYQKLYYSNVVTNTFNLGAFVQGESVPYCLYELLKGGEDCQIRLLVLLISFLPIQYNERFEAEGFTNALYDQFTTALTVITETTLHKETGDVHISKVCIEAYNKYLKLNAQMVGVPVEIPGVTTEEEVLTLHRIVALSRSRFPIHWKKIWFVWKKLPLEDKKKLIRYMTVTGFDFDGETTSIYIYYAPAILSNTMRAAKNVEQFSTEQVLEYLFDKDAWTIGLYHGLLRLLKIYEGVTEKKAYHIYYGKDDADEASKMTVFDTEPLTAPSKEYTASS